MGDDMKNGQIIRIASLILTLIAIGAGVVAGYASLGKDVQQNTNGLTDVREGLKTYVWPEIEASKAHRMTDELNQKYMEKRFDRLEATQRQILEEVRRK